MKYVWLVGGLLIGFVLGGLFGPSVRAVWEEREMRTANEALSETSGLLSELDTFSERRSMLLNERVELAQELAGHGSYDEVAAEPSALRKLERLFTIEHEMIELDERQRWLSAEREALEALKQRLTAHRDGSDTLPEGDWPTVRATLDAVPAATTPLVNERMLRRLFESLGGA